MKKHKTKNVRMSEAAHKFFLSLADKEGRTLVKAIDKFCGV